MVPKGWSAKSLADIVKEKISYGIVQAGPNVPDGVPYIKSSDVRGTINPDMLQRTSKEIHFKYRRSSVHPGDIVFSLRGNIGESAIVPPSLPEANLTQGTARISVSADHSNQFHYYQLASEKILNHINSLSKGSTFKEISLEELRKVKVLCAPLHEQRKIAAILSTWDNAISTTERLIENSKQQKKALMQQLLTGKKRLLDDSGKPFEGDWEEVKLSQLVKVIGGNAFKSEEFKSEGIPLVKISNIKPDYSICLDSAVFIAENEKFEKFKIIKGHVLIAMSGATTGKVGCYQSENFSYLNQRVGRFDVKHGRTINQYLFQLLKLPKVQHEILIDAVGGAQPNISNKDIERIKISVPAVEEQQKIASVLNNADQEIELLEQQLDDLKQEKKALMQQLLTGKRRVKADDKEVA